MYNFIFLLFLLTTPLSLLSMNNKSCKKLIEEKELYFHQLDAKKSDQNWSNSASETFFFIDNYTNLEIPKELKDIIKYNFIALTALERDLWNNEKYNNWNIPITTSDFAHLNKQDKQAIFQLRHANRYTTKNHFSIGPKDCTSTYKNEKIFLFFDHKNYELLQQLPLSIKTKIASVYSPYVVIRKPNIKFDKSPITDAYTGIYTMNSFCLKSAHEYYIKKAIIPTDNLNL
jgi:hypothetical protein